MSGRSFMLATRVPMSRTGFEAWLDTPPPSLDVIENPAAMWTGWAAAGDAADWDLTAFADSPHIVAAMRADQRKTPRELLTDRVKTGGCVARHRDEALELYLYDYHADFYRTRTELLMLAGAGRYADVGAHPVLFWGGNVYADLPIAGDPPLSVLVVSRAGAHFVDRYPIDALVESLRPIEAAFLARYEGDGSAEPDLTDAVDPDLRP
ncbi:hypothetical protein QEZ54_19105 [Catellatospora sp. KI3]|uniref:hypothetical protein n=1 Tax=Catellatospora sp. KI3 TaxID=3041620 RepID=UPI002482F5FC|nr:hypothetical protein [Catellatospora sp. KI3]MDI1463090.1 hypothetical protein [Catellatospora sp. KI3]